METFNPVTRDFVLYCIQRHSQEWPTLYDEMCWVAGHRLFRGLGYSELKELGLSLGLNDIDKTFRIVDSVIEHR